MPEFSQEEIRNKELEKQLEYDLEFENAIKRKENLLADIAPGNIDEREENVKKQIKSTVEEEQREKLEVL